MSSPTEWNAGPAPSPRSAVLDRLLSVLDVVRAADMPLTIADVAARTGLPKSTASRVVADLADRQLLARGPHGVTLGLRVFELGIRARGPRRLIAAAAPVMHRLRDVTGHRVGVWINRGAEMVSLVTISGPTPILPTRTGMRSPALTTASGKAYLAFCGHEDVSAVSRHLVADEADRFRRELTDVRSGASATDDGVAYPGVTAVASPVFGAGDVVIGAVSIAGPQDETDPARLTPLVRAAGAAVSRRIVAA